MWVELSLTTCTFATLDVVFPFYPQTLRCLCQSESCHVTLDWGGWHVSKPSAKKGKAKKVDKIWRNLMSWKLLLSNKIPIPIHLWLLFFCSFFIYLFIIIIIFCFSPYAAMFHVIASKENPEILLSLKMFILVRRFGITAPPKHILIIIIILIITISFIKK